MIREAGCYCCCFTFGAVAMTLFYIFIIHLILGSLFSFESMESEIQRAVIIGGLKLDPEFRNEKNTKNNELFEIISDAIYEGKLYEILNDDISMRELFDSIFEAYTLTLAPVIKEFLSSTGNFLEIIHKFMIKLKGLFDQNNDNYLDEQEYQEAVDILIKGIRVFCIYVSAVGNLGEMADTSWILPSHPVADMALNYMNLSRLDDDDGNSESYFSFEDFEREYNSLMEEMRSKYGAKWEKFVEEYADGKLFRRLAESWNVNFISDVYGPALSFPFKQIAIKLAQTSKSPHNIQNIFPIGLKPKRRKAQKKEL